MQFATIGNLKFGNTLARFHIFNMNFLLKKKKKEFICVYDFEVEFILPCHHLHTHARTACKVAANTSHTLNMNNIYYLLQLKYSNIPRVGRSHTENNRQGFLMINY